MMFRSRGWILAGALLLGPGAALAQSFAVNSPSITVGGQGNVVVTFTNSATPATGMNFDLTYQQAAITRTGAGAVTTSTPAVTCSNVGANIVSCFGADFAGLPATITITIPFVGVAVGTSSLTFTDFAPAGSTLVDGNGAAPGQGTATVVTGPTAPTVGPLAALTLPAGPINLTATGTVPVSITGAGVATASLALSCSIPATGASAFAITSGGTQTINAPATVGPGTPIGVSCVRGAADVTATLTCTQNATPDPDPAALTAAITCPAGTTAPNPGSTPAAPGPIALIGAPGATATGGVNFTNAGGTLAYSVTACTPSAGYTTATTFPVNVAAGGAGAVSVSCTTPVAAGTSGPAGTLACTTTAPGFNPTFNLTCSAQSASIPTLGFGGKALMVLLMLGFGLVGFQLYRRAA